MRAAPSRTSGRECTTLYAARVEASVRRRRPSSLHRSRTDSMRAGRRVPAARAAAGWVARPSSIRLDLAGAARARALFAAGTRADPACACCMAWHGMGVSASALGTSLVRWCGRTAHRKGGALARRGEPGDSSESIRLGRISATCCFACASASSAVPLSALMACTLSGQVHPRVGADGDDRAQPAADRSRDGRRHERRARTQEGPARPLNAPIALWMVCAARHSRGPCAHNEWSAPRKRARARALPALRP